MEKDKQTQDKNWNSLSVDIQNKLKQSYNVLINMGQTIEEPTESIVKAYEDAYGVNICKPIIRNWYDLLAFHPEYSEPPFNDFGFGDIAPKPFYERIIAAYQLKLLKEIAYNETDYPEDEFIYVITTDRSMDNGINVTRLRKVSIDLDLSFLITFKSAGTAEEFASYNADLIKNFYFAAP